MSSIIFQDVNKIEYTSIKFDYLAINSEDILDQNDDEYLLVNKKNDNEYSMVVLDNGIYINTSRDDAKKYARQNINLYAQNGYFEGNLTVKTINVMDMDLSGDDINTLIDKISSNINPFDRYLDPIYNTHVNYYTHNNINILTNSESHFARCNLHPLNIKRSAEHSSYNTQLAIGNNANDDNNNESELLIGIIGNHYESPATVITTPNKELEFYISRSNDDIDNLYNGSRSLPYGDIKPTMKLDKSQCVNINSYGAQILSYDNNTETTKLNVDGYGYIKQLFVDDQGEPKHLDDIYFKKDAQSFNSTDIKSGTFKGNFTFDSLLTIDDTLYSKSNITKSLVVTDLTKTETLDATEITVSNIAVSNIDVKNMILKDSTPLSIQDISVKVISYSPETIEDNLLEEYFYTNEEISNIISDKLREGTIAEPIEGITDEDRLDLIETIKNLTYTIISYNVEEIESSLYDAFSNNGSDISIEFNTLIDSYNLNVFTDLSNDFVVNSEYDVDTIVSDVSNIIYSIGSNIEIYNYIENYNEFNYNDLSNIINPIFLDESFNITTNILSNINLTGFYNLYIEDHYSNTDEDLSDQYSIITENKATIQEAYDDYVSNLVINNLYNRNEIIEKIYLNGLSDYRFSYDINTNFKKYLELSIRSKDSIEEEYSNIIVNNGYSSLVDLGIKNFDAFKDSLNDDLIPTDNLLSFETCVSNINDLISTNDYRNLTSNLNVIFNKFDYKQDKNSIINRQLLNFIVNYDYFESPEDDKQILIYKVNEKIVFNGNDAEIAGRLSLGSSKSDAMLSINKLDSSVPDIHIINNDCETELGYDNSTFKIKTNSGQNHNIELVAGVNGINLFLKADTPNVGINTRNPIKTLDINGEIVANDYYINMNGNQHKVLHFYEDTNKIKLQATKSIEIENTVRYTDGIEVETIKNLQGQNLFNFVERQIDTNSYLHSSSGCLFLGEQPATIGNLENTAMLLQNTLNIQKNNTVIKLLRSNNIQGSTDRYTGIEFTQYSSQPNTGWYIHNNTTSIDLFEIGYKNNYNDTYPILRAQYTADKINNIEIGNKNSRDEVVIKNNLKVEGDINVVNGTYKLKGIELSNDSILITTQYQQQAETITDSLAGDITHKTPKRVINLVGGNSSMFIGTYNPANTNDYYTQFFQSYSKAHHEKTNSTQDEFDAKVNIVTGVKLSSVDTPPLFAIKGVHALDNVTTGSVKSSMRMAILDSSSQNTNTNSYWINNNYTDLNYNYYNDKSIFSIDTVYNSNKFNPLLLINKGNQIHTKIQSAYNTEYNGDTFLHVVDNNLDKLLVLQNNEKASTKIQIINHEKYEWNIAVNNIFKIHNTVIDYNFTDIGFGINVENPSSTFELDNKNNVGITINNNTINADDTIKLTVEYQDISNLEIDEYDDKTVFNLDRLKSGRVSSVKTKTLNETINITQTFYDCNIDVQYNSEYNCYMLKYESESNFTFNIDVDSNLFENNLLEKLHNLSNIVLTYFEISHDINEDDVNVSINIKSLYSLVNSTINKTGALSYDIYLDNSHSDDCNIITISNIDFNIYKGTDNSIIFTADIDNYTVLHNIEVKIISGLETNLDITDYEINFLKDEYKSDTASTIQLSKTCNISEFNLNLVFDEITLTYYELNEESNFEIDVIENQKHIKLQTNNEENYYIATDNDSFNIFYEGYVVNNILKLQKDGILKINELVVNKIVLLDYIYDAESHIFCNENFNSIDIKHNHLYINTNEGYSILVNTDSFEDINQNANIIFGNKTNITNSDIITLQSSSTDAYIKLTNDTNNYYNIGRSSDSLVINRNNSELFKIAPISSEIDYSNFSTDEVNAFEISDGNLQAVNKTITTNNQYIFTEGKITGIKHIDYTNDIVFSQNNDVIMSLNKDDITAHKRLICNSGITTGSDKRIKENINMIENALDKIDKLNGVSYFNKLSKSNEIGLIAQDVKEVVPEVVTGDELLGIQYGNMIGLLIEGIKELRKEIRNGKD